MTKQKKSGRITSAPPAGTVRASQMLTTYGPGSLVDLMSDAVIIKGTDSWSYTAHDGTRLKPEHLIYEHRLQRSLQKRFPWFQPHAQSLSGFVRPPIYDPDYPTRRLGVHASIFPRMMICRGCKALVRYTTLKRRKSDGAFLHACNKTDEAGKKLDNLCVPVRFVAACENGHIEDFPWGYFVHEKTGHDCSKKNQARLFLREGAIGDFSDAEVKCEACGSSRRLLEARSAHGGLPFACKGYRPWLPEETSEGEECDKELRLLVRTASNTYFAAIESALSIPAGTSKLFRLVKELEQKIPGGLEASDTFVTVMRKVCGAESTDEFSDKELQAGIADYLAKQQGAATEEPLRVAEHRRYMCVGDGSEPVDDGSISTFAARLAKISQMPRGISRVVNIEKLREVRVLVGFGRLSAPTRSMQGEVETETKLARVSRHGEWLPAAEIHGEGVFVELDNDQLAEWESRPAVKRREQQLRDGFDSNTAFSATDEFPGMRFYLIHSLAHALVQELAIECGYAASALRERLYCSSPKDSYQMNGLLISTGTPGSEGTMGGLVAQGDQLHKRLSNALAAARLCSNDPVCGSRKMEHQRQSDGVDGAACHGCMYISESSCEWFNKHLDRGLLVPTINQDPELAYFDLNDGVRP